MQELAKIVLDRIKKQTDTFVLLSVVCYALYFFGSARLAAQEHKIDSLTEEVRICDKERERLRVQVEWMTIQLNTKFPTLGLQALQGPQKR